MRTGDVLHCLVPTSKAETTIPSTAPSKVTLSASISSTPSSTVMTWATAPAVPNSTANAFKMSAASIVAAVVLCYFFCGGTVVLLDHQIRRYLAWRRRRRWSNLAKDCEHGVKQKFFGDCLVPSGISQSESIMCHPEQRKCNSAVSPRRDDVNQDITEQESPYDHRISSNGILMGEIAPSDEAERSPVSPLMSPTFPCQVSIVSRNNERRSLRRDFGFDDIHKPLSVPPKESRPSRRLALSSHPPWDCPSAIPSYYGRGFPPRPIEQ